MNKYALIGGKLSHSFSPKIHEKIFMLTNTLATYELIEAEENDLESLINLLKSGFYSGFNVTIPHKINVMKYLDVISNEAKEIGAVNTISMKNGKTIGYNTDYFGFIDLLDKYDIDVKNKNVVILGAGGAARAVYHALLSLKANITFAVREDDLPSGLALGKTVLLDNISNLSYDVIINTTPVGMYPNVSFSPIKEIDAKKASKIVDIIYNPQKTKLLSYANYGCNGLYMLVSQAVKAEEIFLNCNLEKITDEVFEYVKGVIR